MTKGKNVNIIQWLIDQVSPAQVGGLVRTAIAAIGGALVLKGVGDVALWDIVAGGGATLAVGIWSYLSKKPK